jgi:O-antigen/teichoic acid export membrane protein
VRDSVRHLSKGVAIYGAGDAAVQVVNFLLIAVYVKLGFLVAVDYGALAIIIAIEMLAKLVSRWGLDGAFMRFYHDRPAGGPLERLTSTIVWFTLAADAVVFAALLAASGWIGGRLFDEAAHLLAFRLMLVNTFLISLTFVPFHLMRLRGEAATYSALVFVRSAGTVVVRVVLVIGLGWGLVGWFAADLLLTLVLLPVLWRWMRPLLRPVFSAPELRLVLRFGLPRLPHGLAQQALDAGNKLLLNEYVPASQLGVYQNGFTLGTAIRFFTSAFETAWAPFYYETARKPGAPVVLAKIATYGVAILAVLVAVTTAVSRDLILVMLTPEYLEATRVMPLIALGMGLQGVYLLTSIGLNLTSRTQFYPVATFAALAVGLGSGLLLMPRQGMAGAAIAFLLSTATQTGVAFLFARRFYPIPYETGRLARVIAAGALAAAAGLWAVPEWPPVAGVLARAIVTGGVFGTILVATGFFRRSERAFLTEVLAGWRRRRAVDAARGGSDGA